MTGRLLKVQALSARCFFILGGGGSGHGKLAKPAHQKALEKSLGTREISRNQGSELSSATIVPEGHVVAV